MHVYIFHVGIFVVSREFVTREWPMKELMIFLERWEADRNSVDLLPVFFGLMVEDCDSIRDIYDDEKTEWRDGKPDAGKLEQWAQAVGKLKEFAGIRDAEKVCG